jgi:xanthine dehydrogenase accessory factor
MFAAGEADAIRASESADGNCLEAPRSGLAPEYDRDVDAVPAAKAALGRGQRAALVTVTEVTGDPPSRAGMSLAVVEGGTAFGSLGCDGFDRAATADGARALESGQRFVARYPWDGHSLVTVDVRPLRPGDAVPSDETSDAEVLVVGSGPVARALVSLASRVGLRVRVAAGPQREAAGEFEAGEVVSVSDAAEVRAMAPGPQTYVVICGHDEEFSQPVLRSLLATDVPYLGMMGSRRHTGHLLEELRAAGFTEDRLRRVHSPVGLKIGAQTPEEIALSALAEIVAERRAATRPDA